MHEQLTFRDGTTVSFMPWTDRDSDGTVDRKVLVDDTVLDLDEALLFAKAILDAHKVAMEVAPTILLVQNVAWMWVGFSNFCKEGQR